MKQENKKPVMLLIIIAWALFVPLAFLTKSVVPIFAMVLTSPFAIWAMVGLEEESEDNNQ